MGWGDHVKTEAEAGGMWPHAQNSPRELDEERKRSLGASGGVTTPVTPFQTSSSSQHENKSLLF